MSSFGLTALNLPFTVRDGSQRDASRERFPIEVAVRRRAGRDGSRRRHGTLAYGEGASGPGPDGAARYRSRGSRGVRREPYPLSAALALALSSVTNASRDPAARYIRSMLIPTSDIFFA